MIPIYNPYKIETSINTVTQILEEGWISWSGKYVTKCEAILSTILGCKYVLLTNSGTSATHCIVKSIKFKYPYCKKIYIPNSCYIAVYNCTLMEFKKEQIEILPIDINTYNLDINYIQKLEKNAALFIVHNLGNTVNVIDIKSKRPDLIIIEDNCEGFMGTYNNKKTGSECLASSISFFANKHITCGEGGAFCTNDLALYNYIKSYCRQGITDEKFIHNKIATNYRITNLQAGLLYTQLNLLDEIIERKRYIINYYKKELEKVLNIKFQKIDKQTQHSYWIFSIRIINNPSYEIANSFFTENNIETRPFFYDTSRHLHLKNLKTIECNNCKILSREIIILPSFPNLKDNELDYIITKVTEYSNSLNE